jgi:regulator of protease activity HflC (stomatin/prohibitin superfamily)
MAFLIIIASIVALVTAIATKKMEYRALIIAASIVALLVGGLMRSVQIVQVGSVAIVYEFGAIVDQLGEGLHFIPPWRESKPANVKVQKFTFKNLLCFSQETQDVLVDLTLNYRVSPDIIQELYRNTGTNYFEVLIAPKIPQITKDETVKYKTADVAPSREAIRIAIRDRLKDELRPFSIEVVDVLLENIDFNPEFKKAIEAKQIATQKALEEQEKVKGEQFRAQQMIEKAKGEAESNRLISESISPQIIQYLFVQKLSDKIQLMMIPSENPFILDPSKFLTPAN